MATSPWNGALGNTQPPASAWLCAELRSSHFSFFEVKEADPAPCRRRSRASLSHTACSRHTPPPNTLTPALTLKSSSRDWVNSKLSSWSFICCKKNTRIVNAGFGAILRMTVFLISFYGETF